MKKLIFGTLLSTLFMLFSCSEDSTTEAEQTSGATMTATVNGNAWSSITGGVVASVIDASFGGETNKALQLVGASQSSTSFNISIPIQELAIGSHTFSGESASGILGYFNQTSFSTSQHASGQFTVTVTALNFSTGIISGTFSGVLYDDNDVAMNITNGAFNNVPIFSSDFFSNGSMSLKRNGGQLITMDGGPEDGKYVTITQSIPNNSISLFGNNSNLTSDFGMYVVNFPRDVATGTFPLTDSGTYSAGLGSSDNQPEYNLISGSLTITSHNGNNVVGTFSYTVNNGVQTVTITNGAFNITHN